MSEVEQIDLDQLSYDELKKKAHEIAGETAATFIPKMCKKLRAEDKEMSNTDIRNTVKQDLIDTWSPVTIDKFIPEEFKPKKKKEAPEQIVTQTTDGKQETTTIKSKDKDEKLQDLKKELQQKNKQLEAKENLLSDQKQKYEAIRKENEELKQSKQFAEVANTLDEQQPQQGDIRYYAFNFHNQQLNRDFARFLRIWKTLTEDVWVKVHDNRVVRIITKEEKDKELEAIASV